MLKSTHILLGANIRIDKATQNNEGKEKLYANFCSIENKVEMNDIYELIVKFEDLYIAYKLANFNFTLEVSLHKQGE
jgi:hypothetical protein